MISMLVWNVVFGSKSDVEAIIVDMLLSVKREAKSIVGMCVICNSIAYLEVWIMTALRDVFNVILMEDT